MKASNDDEFNAELNAINATLQAEVDARNRHGLDDFMGLSPAQMSALLYKPFDSPDVVTFPDTVEGADAPILTLFLLLAERIGEKGVKATATGNLPRNLCREVAQIYMGEAGYLERTRYGGINKETDFYDLHITRLVASLAKLTRKYRGKVLLTNKAKKLLESEHHGALYMELFKSFCTEYNWGYWDAYIELHIMQQAFAFHVHSWQQMGNEMQVSGLLTSRVLDAFPMMVDEVMETGNEYINSDPARYIEQCYTTRALHRFGKFFGLLEVEGIKEEGKGFASHYEVTAKPLLSQVMVLR